MSNQGQNNEHRRRQFLTDWLIKSADLLGDKLEQLDRIPLDELFELADQRQEKLRKVAEQNQREAKALSCTQGAGDPESETLRKPTQQIDRLSASLVEKRFEIDDMPALPREKRFARFTNRTDIICGIGAENQGTANRFASSGYFRFHFSNANGVTAVFFSQLRRMST